jgi:HlyD family secretion protein
MKRRVWVMLALVALVVIVVVGIWRAQAGRAATVPAQESQEATIERGSLRLSVNATGRVALETELALSFKTTGRLAEVVAKEGDRVQAGDLVARLETSELEQSVMQAEAGLEGAEAQLAKARVGARPEEVAGAEAQVTMAEAGVLAADAAVEMARGNLAGAQASLASAQATLNRLVAGPTALELQIAEKQVELARNQLWGLQGQRDAVGDTNAAQREAAAGQAAAAESQVVIAQLQLEALRSSPRAEDVAQARAQVSLAEAGVVTARAQVAQAEAQRESARGQRAQAEAQLAMVRAGSREEDIALAEAQVAQARAQFSRAKFALAEARLVAPVDGLVASTYLRVTELAAAGQPVLLLVQDAMYHININVDEADIGQVSEGQTVAITLDAYPGHALEGRVASISPVARMEGGIVSYNVRVDIPYPDVPIREGLTANATIVARSAENVLLVPNGAIGIDPETGAMYVTRLNGAAEEMVRIEVGLQSDMVSEVVAGLAQGDRVMVRGTSYRDQFREMMESTFRQR